MDPFRRVRRGIEQCASLSRELLGRGHLVRGFGGNTSSLAGTEVDLTAGLIGFHPDVILVHGIDSTAAWKGARAASKLDVPLVGLEEGFPSRGRTVGRALRSVGAMMWGGYVRRRMVHAVALDAVAERQLLDRGVEPHKVVRLETGVDLSRYRPGLASHLASEHGVTGRILLVCANPHGDVGLDAIVRAFAETVGRTGHWSLVMCGKGAAFSGLRELSDQLGVGGGVHLLPKAERAFLPGLFGASTLMLLPNDPEDAPGWRARRALACGLPVVALRTPSSEDLIEHDDTGLLVDHPDEWAAALRLATSAPQRRARWSRRARELAEERYDWAHIAARLEDVLLQATQRSVTEVPWEGDPGRAAG